MQGQQTIITVNNLLCNYVVLAPIDLTLLLSLPAALFVGQRLFRKDTTSVYNHNLMRMYQGHIYSQGCLDDFRPN